MNSHLHRMQACASGKVIGLDLFVDMSTSGLHNTLHSTLYTVRTCLVIIKIAGTLYSLKNQEPHVQRYGTKKINKIATIGTAF